MANGAPTASRPAETPQARWRIPDWFRRLGQASWLFLGIVAAIILVVYAIGATNEILAPLVMAGFLAIVFAPAVDWLADRGFRRSLGALTVLVVLALAFAAVSLLMTWALVNQSDELTENLNNAVADIKQWLDDTPINQELADQVRNASGDAGPALAGGVADQAVSLVDSAVGFIAGLVLGVVILYYLLKDGATLAGRWIEKEEDKDKQELLGRIGEHSVKKVQGYFKGRTAMAVVNGATIGLAALLLGVPAAGAIAVVNFVGAYIPFLGAFIGGGFAVVMALGDGGITLALIMLAIALGVNLLLENLLEPVLLGDSLDLHPLLILLATSLGGLVAGMIGLILAAPALAIALDIRRELKAAGFFDEE